MARQKVDLRWLSSDGGPTHVKPATLVTRAGQKFLVLEVDVAGYKDTRYILEDKVGTYACDHDGPVSKCGRCADCGVSLL
jgi:hypothetical protein